MDHIRSPVQDGRRWAWIAGASEGLGLAFADELAQRGYNLVLFARREHVLETEAERLRGSYQVDVFTHALDLSADNLEQYLSDCVMESPPHIGVYNAAYTPVGQYLSQTVAELMHVVDTNVRGPLVWARVLGEAMRNRGSGALVFISSLAGNQGSPNISAYAASKAFNRILSEGLWSELKTVGIDVLVCCAGAVRTPGFERSASSDALGILDAKDVATLTLDRLGKGPKVVPGRINRVASLVVGRWLPRPWAIAVMSRATKDLTSQLTSR
ncbi:MAG: SDR family NAD(P)-dependent oxidoreductase [Pseudomonadales bacterium]